MITAKILINSDVHEVSAMIKIVAIPREGGLLWLSDQTKRHLEKLATKDLETARYFAPNWFYGASHGVTHERLKQEHLNNFSLDDLNCVHEVMYHENLEYVTIVMKEDYHE
jgi:hypothetical protein